MCSRTMGENESEKRENERGVVEERRYLVGVSRFPTIVWFFVHDDR